MRDPSKYQRNTQDGLRESFDDLHIVSMYSFLSLLGINRGLRSIYRNWKIQSRIGVYVQTLNDIGRFFGAPPKTNSNQSYFFFVGDGDAFGVALGDGFEVAAPPEIVELPGTTVLVFVVDLILPEMLTFGGEVTTGFVGFFGVADLVATGAG